MSDALLVIFGPIVKPFLLVFSPAWIWEKEFRAQRGVAFNLIFFLLPLLVISSLAETHRLVQWGVLRGEFAHRKLFLLGEATVFEAARFLLSLIVVFVCAQMV
jgi:hypothetical protein